MKVWWLSLIHILISTRFQGFYRYLVHVDFCILHVGVITRILDPQTSIFKIFIQISIVVDNQVLSARVAICLMEDPHPPTKAHYRITSTRLSLTGFSLVCFSPTLRKGIGYTQMRVKIKIKILYVFFSVFALYLNCVKFDGKMFAHVSRNCLKRHYTLPEIFWF